MNRDTNASISEVNVEVRHGLASNVSRLSRFAISNSDGDWEIGHQVNVSKNGVIQTNRLPRKKPNVRRNRQFVGVQFQMKHWASIHVLRRTIGGSFCLCEGTERKAKPQSKNR